MNPPHENQRNGKGGKSPDPLELFRASKKLFWLSLEQLQDGWRFFRATWKSPNRSTEDQRSIVEGEIIKTYHVLEKALAMSNFTELRATDKVLKLQQLLQEWSNLTGEQPDRFTGQAGVATSVLHAYAESHRSRGIDPDSIVDPRFAQAARDLGGGVELSSKPDPERAAAFRELAQTRRSIRAFTNETPPPELIERCIRDGMRSPSVCNRQTWRAHYYTGQDVQKVLAHQTGNRGFGQQVPAVLVITSDLRAFQGSGERYQAWIDGGMFSMSVLLSLHANGLGAVTLNWSVANKTDRALRQVAKIPDHERIILLIGLGYTDETRPVPVSARKPLDEILTHHNLSACE
ncbi:nitroreductase family protein [Cerasicoccus frondis]|uniref:nitroreductase family protein n=1 Tax=Cerasicoccus frondis TaxID=490090 RepID=UPI002852D481|nr:nitroreductase family protein [Cerasicoccus frondis]